ncbi:MAG: hypothetical protein AABY07_06020, partial [Nanoarchaeota archaeon]
MKKYKIFILCYILIFYISINLALAHDGPHQGCFQNGCPPGHSTSLPFPNNCPWTDPSCSPSPFQHCDLASSLTLSPGNYPVQDGFDICANNIVLDCGGAAIEANPPGTFGA